MQFKSKLDNQTWENGKKLISGPSFTRFAQIRAPIFFHEFFLY